MRLALYSPNGGYYTSDRVRIGIDGDFYTSPATHPAFGAVLALQLEQMWRLLNEPRSFTVVEGGGAKGFLARDILRYAVQLTPEFFDAITYVILENDKAGYVKYQTDGEIAVSWDAATEMQPITDGVFLSNELFDAFPRHRVAKEVGDLFEIYVSLSADGDFIELLDEPSTPALREYLTAAGVDLPERCRAEIDLEGAGYLENVANKIQRGFTITIDYGYHATDLYSERWRQGTILAYYKHTATNNYYIRVGRQDLTAHVDFTTLARGGERGGMVTEGLLTQQHFLKKLGIQTFLDRLREAGLRQDAYMTNRMSLLELTQREGFGQFGVLLQSKGIGRLGLDTLVDSRARHGDPSLTLPVLSDEHMPLMEGRYPHMAMQDFDIDRFL